MTLGILLYVVPDVNRLLPGLRFGNSHDGRSGQCVRVLSKMFDEHMLFEYKRCKYRKACPVEE